MNPYSENFEVVDLGNSMSSEEHCDDKSLHDKAGS